MIWLFFWSRIRAMDDGRAVEDDVQSCLSLHSEVALLGIRIRYIVLAYISEN